MQTRTQAHDNTVLEYFFSACVTYYFYSEYHLMFLLVDLLANLPRGCGSNTVTPNCLCMGLIIDGKDLAPLLMMLPVQFLLMIPWVVALR